MSRANRKGADDGAKGIARIIVSGFKSLAGEHEVAISPLTILAGANSSGKSSLMQVILLLKQTLEAAYDPGPLLLDGPNVRFSRVEELLFRGSGEREVSSVVFGLGLVSGYGSRIVLRRQSGGQLAVESSMVHMSGGETIELTPEMPEQQILQSVPLPEEVRELPPVLKHAQRSVRVERDRCFLRLVLEFREPKARHGLTLVPYSTEAIRDALLNIIHLPGLRGNPARAYPLTATGPQFPGTFHEYTASLISKWSSTHDDRLVQLGDDLKSLGLTWKVEAKAVDDTKVELRVGRMLLPRRGGAQDLVNIADVGFGVSQVLPVVVALLSAEPGQVLYVEQPENHLHPRAQVAMARLLVDAANRGVVTVVETHSSLILLGIQSLVSEGLISPSQVKLHWFQRNDTDGATTITTAELDERGRFGDWPADFDEVMLNIQMRYLNASESREGS
ncbi:MAG: DUF3696 domain-containing protein [Planctomycetes bacterium]|nr:DUF3696 domain-containing protein [Planctomycetota bacterium]